MDETIVQQIIDGLFPSLETIEAQSAAVLQLIKDKRIASDEDISHYLDEAGKASEVRWRGIRVRINRLLLSLDRASENEANQATRCVSDDGEEKGTKEGEVKREDHSPDAVVEQSKTGAQESRTGDQAGGRGPCRKLMHTIKMGKLRKMIPKPKKWDQTRIVRLRAPNDEAAPI
jgi:hypothetical protein